MKRYWSGLAVAGMLAATAALGAQSQNPANTPPPDSAAQPGSQREQTSPSAQARTPNTVTVRGCIENAPTASAPGATSPGAAGQQAATRFVLGNARMTATGDAGRSAVGTTGTAATMYQLDGQTAEISKHLNHQVEITGMVQSSSASATGSSRAAEGSTAAGPTLRVTSVRMLSATCDTATTPGTTGVAPDAPRPSTPPEDPKSPSGGNPSGVPPEPRPNQEGPATRP